ncbi:MAG: VOC family protein [Salaquimonas sp.]
MKLTLHHINLATENVERMNTFYRDVLGLDGVDAGLPTLEKKKGYAGDVAFAGAKTHSDVVQYHLAQKDIHAGFNSGHTVNPVSRGHIAFRTDDLDAFKKRLEAKGVPYSDWGNAAVETWHQIFFYDPDGNVIEVHQVQEA